MRYDACLIKASGRPEFYNLDVHMPVQGYYNCRYKCAKAEAEAESELDPEAISQFAFAARKDIKVAVIAFSKNEFARVLGEHSVHTDPAFQARQAYAYVCAIAVFKRPEIWIIEQEKKEDFKVKLKRFCTPFAADPSGIGLLAVPMVLDIIPNFLIDPQYDFFIRHIMPVLGSSFVMTPGEDEEGDCLQINVPPHSLVDPEKCVYSPLLSAFVDPFCGISHGIFEAVLAAEQHDSDQPWFYAYQFLQPHRAQPALAPLQFGIVQSDGDVTWPLMGSTFELNGRMIKCPDFSPDTREKPPVRILLTVHPSIGIVPIALDPVEFSVPITGFLTRYTLFMPGGNGVSTRYYQIYDSQNGESLLTGRMTDQGMLHVSPLFFDVKTGCWRLEAWALFNHAPHDVPEGAVSANGRTIRDASGVKEFMFRPGHSGSPLVFDYGWKEGLSLLPAPQYPAVSYDDESGKIVAETGGALQYSRDFSAESLMKIPGYADHKSAIESAVVLNVKLALFKSLIDNQKGPEITSDLLYKAFQDIFLSGRTYLVGQGFFTAVMSALSRGYAKLIRDGCYPDHLVAALSFFPSGGAGAGAGGPDPGRPG
jgi:hypothetical protein